MIKFSFSIEHVHHTMIEASADLSGTELELSDVTSRHHQRGGAGQLQEEEDKTYEVYQ